MSIDSLPEAFVSLMTFDIIFFSFAPRRSTLPIYSEASNPAALGTTPFLARVSASQPSVSNHVQRFENMCVMMENRGFQTLTIHA